MLKGFIEISQGLRVL